MSFVAFLPPPLTSLTPPTPHFSRSPFPSPPFPSSPHPIHPPTSCLPPPKKTLSEKVQTYLESLETRRPPSNPLPINLDLLNHHARLAARTPSTHARAEALFRRAISLNRSDGRAWLGLAQLHMKRKRIPSARRIFRRAVRESPHNAHLLQAWGVLEERECDVTRAKELFDAAVRADAEHCAAWVALGLWHQRYDGDIEKAREMFRTGAEAQPDNYYVWHVWGVLERNCRNFPLARLYFRRGTEANPRNAATFVLWGALEDGLGNSEAAFRLFEKAHGANGRNVHAYVAHAVARERMGDVKMARRLLRRGMKIRPDDAAMWQTMGLLEFRLGDVEKARRLFKKGLAVDERHAPSWCAWAGVEEKCGHFDRARELFQQAVWARPRGADAVRTWHAWACLEMADGKWEAARRCFAHGLKMGPSNVALLTGIGRVEAEAGDMAQARKYFEMAVGLEPRLKATWKLYQQMEMTFGNRKRAQSVYQRHLSVVGKKEERVMVSDALPGDYMAGGMWCEQPKERVDKLGDKYSSGSLLPPNSSYNLNFTVNAFNLTT